MADRPIIIAVDFDGCLCVNAWPDIGEARQEVIHALLERQKQGAKIILWTCRVDERLDEAVAWCAEHGITFDAVNSNLPANVAAFGNDCRKIYADEYWDDKARNPETSDVSIPTYNADNHPILFAYSNDAMAKRMSERRMSEKNNIKQTRICDIPISPNCTREIFGEFAIDPECFAKAHELLPTGRVSVNPRFFLMMLETMKSIVESADWQKKARIVLEYDPQAEKMDVVTFTESF